MLYEVITMGIPMPEGFDVLMVAGLLAALALLARYVIFFPLLYFTGLDRGNAMVASTRLAQISEFSLVISFMGMQLGHITHGLNSAIIFAFVITSYSIHYTKLYDMTGRAATAMTAPAATSKLVPEMSRRSASRPSWKTKTIVPKVAVRLKTLSSSALIGTNKLPVMSYNFV